MFGIVQPCRNSLSPALRRQWTGHLCGLCLGLRDGHGQAARATTNVDAVALSVLVEAQRDEAIGTRRAGPCPLRGFRPATVVRADDPGIRHAVAVSLTMAATKLDDHVADRDGWIARVPVLPAAAVRRWGGAGDRAAEEVGLDAGALRASVAESTRRESVTGRPFDEYAAPTEDAAALVLRHTATLADRPANAAGLDALGRAFGRIVYLIDAVRDLADDQARGHFNPLVASVADADRRLDVATGLLADAHRRLTDAFDGLDLPQPALARALFVDQVRRAADSALRAAGRHVRTSCASRSTVAPAMGLAVAAGSFVWAQADGRSEEQNRSCWDRCGDCCSGCCECDCDCCECDCCDCDCCGCDC